jgi:hypothetical protein
MSGDIRKTTTALEKAIGAALPTAPRPYVSVGRPGWSWRDLLSNRVNLCLVKVSEDQCQSNELLPSRPNARAVFLTYMATFYGSAVEDHFQAVMGTLARQPYLEAGLTALVLNPSLDELGAVWKLFRRKYALSLLIEVKGTIVSAD